MNNYYGSVKCKETMKKYQTTDNFKESRRNYDYKKYYGITLKEYDDLVLKQNGLCAICGSKETLTFKGKIKRLSVDHNHTTKRVRELLCDSCNKCIGLVNENIDVLARMVSYLKKHM